MYCGHHFAAGGAWLTAARLASAPGMDYVTSLVAKLARRPDGGVKLTATGNEDARESEPDPGSEIHTFYVVQS